MKFYRALLHLYPRSFRNEYGDEMTALFGRRHRDAAGGFATFSLWIAAMLDTIRTAFLVHWDILSQDLRYTLRSLRRTPGFAITAIVVTALGIGANTAAFSVADFVLIRPLPFLHSERLVELWESGTDGGTGQNQLSPPNYLDWKSASKSYDVMGAYTGRSANLLGRGEPLQVQGLVVTSEIFPMLGISPIAGRSFLESDMGDDAPETVVLSYGLWQSAFGGERNILGQQISLSGRSHTVIGVMPPSFHFPNPQVQFWAPFKLSPGTMGVQDFTDRTNTFINVVARLKPGVTASQAQGELRGIAGRLAIQYPKDNEGVSGAVVRLRDEFSQQSRLLLLVLCGAALCILLIACANLASLLLARALSRRRELSVRAALGAGRERLVRQMVTESILLAGVGGMLGVIVARLSVPLLTRLVPNSLPLASAPTVDLRVLLFAALATCITGLAFGVAPAFRAGSQAGLTGLREGSRAGGGRKERLRSTLVVIEVMASVVLLISSGLLLKAMLRLQAVDPGFRSDNVLTLRTNLPLPRYARVADRHQYYSRVLENIRRIPGVSNAAFISYLPMAMGGGIWGIEIPGQPTLRGAGTSASIRFASPGFFSSLRIPVTQGRDIAETDAPPYPNAAVVSESFAKHFFPGTDPIGQHFTIGQLPDRVIVGVVGDIRVRGPEQTSEPQVYLSYQQVPDSSFTGYTPRDLVVHSTLPTATLLPMIRRMVHEADADQPIANVRSMTEIVAEQTASRSVQVRVLGALALLAFLLAGIGIHGLLSFSVSQRAQEFGVRRALGAQAGDIMGMVVRHGAMLAMLGVMPGIAIAYAAGRVMSSLLVSISPGDAPTFLVVGGLCLGMTVVGCLFPALKAMRVDPALVMRAE